MTLLTTEEANARMRAALVEILAADTANDPGLSGLEAWEANNRYLVALENGRAVMTAEGEQGLMDTTTNEIESRGREIYLTCTAIWSAIGIAFYDKQGAKMGGQAFGQAYSTGAIVPECFDVAAQMVREAKEAQG